MQRPVVQGAQLFQLLQHLLRTQAGCLRHQLSKTGIEFLGELLGGLVVRAERPAHGLGQARDLAHRFWQGEVVLEADTGGEDQMGDALRGFRHG
ncbi:hypothetical protein DM872_19120 [Pseudomonas taiwanensis]|nr:hypothetical protein [Pseudomonas taiwanensis]